MKTQKRSVAKDLIDLFKIEDKRLGKVILDFIFESSKEIGKEFNSLLSNAKFNRILNHLIDGKDFLGRDMEWVLVIPLHKYMEDASDEYELIFGIGQQITKKSLFLNWNPKVKQIEVMDLKYDIKRRDIMSLHEAHNMATQYGIDMPKVHPYKKPLCCATIENIKEFLRWGMKDKDLGLNILKVRDRNFLFKPVHLKTELKNLNIILLFLKQASLVLMRDVYDERYFYQKRENKISLEFDAYAVVRKFLKYARLFPERRSGDIRRVRYNRDEKKLIIKRYILYKGKGEKRSLEYVIDELGLKSPSHKQLISLQNQIDNYSKTHL